MTPAGAPRLHLRVLATTDLHMQMVPHDYLSDCPAPGRSLLSVAKLLPTLRDEFLAQPGRAVLLVDNGDTYQGSPVSEAVQRAARQKHPMIEAMNLLGYDAATPGNHDFCFGMDGLEELSRQACFPLVSSNIAREKDKSPDDGGSPLKRWAILRKTAFGADGSKIELKIGIVGLAPPQTLHWERFSLEPDVGANGIVETARKLLPELKKAGADIVIALAHSGIADRDSFDRTENAVAELAKHPDIDAIVAGHVHRVFPGPGWNDMADIDPVRGSIHGKPVIMPGVFGTHLGRIDLDLVKDASGLWKAEGFVCQAEPAEQETLDEAELENGPLGPILHDTHDHTLRFIRRQIGATPSAIHSYFTFAAPCTALSITARAIAHFAANEPALRRPDHPLLIAVSPYRAGGIDGSGGYVDIPDGPLLLRHAAELYPFPDELCSLELDGEMIRRWLERSATVFAKIAPARSEQPLIDIGVPSYQFDVIHGLTYMIDPSRTEGRVSDVRYVDGTPLAPDDRVTLLTNSYRANGGGGFIDALSAHAVKNHGVPVTDILTSYFGSPDFDPRVQEVWRFARIPDTSAVFLSGPGAPGHLASLKGRSIRHDGPAENGFHRFIVDF